MWDIHGYNWIHNGIPLWSLCPKCPVPNVLGHAKQAPGECQRTQPSSEATRPSTFAQKAWCNPHAWGVWEGEGTASGFGSRWVCWVELVRLYLLLERRWMERWTVETSASYIYIHLSNPLLGALPQHGRTTVRTCAPWRMGFSQCGFRMFFREQRSTVSLRTWHSNEAKPKVPARVGYTNSMPSHLPPPMGLGWMLRCFLGKTSKIWRRWNFDQTQEWRWRIYIRGTLSVSLGLFCISCYSYLAYIDVVVGDDYWPGIPSWAESFPEHVPTSAVTCVWGVGGSFCLLMWTMKHVSLCEPTFFWAIWICH